jgi:hypothetical protein
MLGSPGTPQYESRATTLKRGAEIEGQVESYLRRNYSPGPSLTLAEVWMFILIVGD